MLSGMVNLKNLVNPVDTQYREAREVMIMINSAMSPVRVKGHAMSPQQSRWPVRANHL